MRSRWLVHLVWLGRDWAGFKPTKSVFLTSASHTYNQLIISLPPWSNSAQDLYFSHRQRALNPGWLTLRFLNRSVPGVVPVLHKGPDNSLTACVPELTLIVTIFPQNWLFILWFNYLLSQVHLLWSFLNVRAWVLKCEPSFGLCSKQAWVNTACKQGAFKSQWLRLWASAPVLCSSAFPGCFGEGVSIPCRALGFVFLWVLAHIGKHPFSRAFVL